MPVDVVFRAELDRGRVQPAPETATCLVDLGLPCHLACPDCCREPAAPAALGSARQRLLGAAVAASPRRLRTVFYGGDVFTAPHAFAALLAEVGAECEVHGRELQALVLSDGVDWDRHRCQELARRGVACMQVTLDGPAELHDRLRPLATGGGSFQRILDSLRYQRDALPVVVRMNALPGDPAVETLAEVLERAGLFAEPNPIVLYVAPPALYREQVLDLLHLVDARGPRPGCGAALGVGDAA
ncbi:MAG TPA: radical SAM protein [Anaeromyxobacteraceae bacterium]